MNRILIVEDDRDIANMLNIYFRGQGYEVSVARRAEEALNLTRESLPHLIVLDIMLPDTDGYEVCRNLRTTSRTSQIPIIFLTQKDTRSDRIAGLELGADDYVTKPFDIEELRLRVQNAIARSKRESLTDPRTGLPSGRLIEERLRLLLAETGWALIEIELENYQAFREAYGFVAGDDILRMTAQVITSALDRDGTDADFAGHPGAGTFIVITASNRASQIVSSVKESFNRRVLSYYSDSDRERGSFTSNFGNGSEKSHPLMKLSIGVLDGSRTHFDDIQELSEQATLARQAGAEDRV